MIRLDHVHVRHKARGGGLFDRSHVHALTDASLEVGRGEIVGLVGESGCGKSTLARVLTGLQRPTEGTVTFHGEDLWAMPGARRGDDKARDARVEELLDLVGLPAHTLRALPGQLSGGQRQRVAIARALALEPELIVADEPTSALDVSVRAQVLNLLVDLRDRLNLGMVFISHDIQTVRHLADRLAVLYLGRIVEEGPARRVAASPAHPYTQALLSATPSLMERSERIVLHGPVPSAVNPPPGCPFSTRCWKADDACVTAFPAAGSGPGESHRWHCVHPQTEDDRS
ncbi:ABC transporter ATP-binding protein [Streptomyces sp. CoT10]|uniref:oligopeptide/dipeptide ABC transporter ATP-binding protein n=1 Tax=Streptomyces sp. CoT10 TaxID=2875762 RepID=UPI001CD434C8|nr:ABC transporter ATP-binding protein [Streptomyces sp. CoT10]